MHVANQLCNLNLRIRLTKSAGDYSHTAYLLLADVSNYAEMLNTEDNRAGALQTFGAIKIKYEKYR
jgi:hypothetical protein